MTLDDVKSMEKETLSLDETAAVIGCNAQSLRLQIKKDRAQLGFPVIVHGSRMVVPRRAFVRFMEGSAV